MGREFFFFFFLLVKVNIFKSKDSGVQNNHHCDDSDLQTSKSPETAYMLKAWPSTCGAIGRWWDLYEVRSIGRNLGDCHMSMKDMLSPQTTPCSLLISHILTDMTTSGQPHLLYIPFLIPLASQVQSIRSNWWGDHRSEIVYQNKIFFSCLFLWQFCHSERTLMEPQLVLLGIQVLL